MMKEMTNNLKKDIAKAKMLEEKIEPYTKTPEIVVIN